MAKFKFAPRLMDGDRITARIADGAGVANQLTDADSGKLVALVGDSQYGLCADGAEIEGVLVALDGGGTRDGFNIGTVQLGGRIRVKFGEAVALKDKVVAAAPVARGTRQGSEAPTVKKAVAVGTFSWRVVSFDGTGTGAVGQYGLIEKI